jgi:hypothetical protein
MGLSAAQVIEHKKFFKERLYTIFQMAPYSRPTHETLLQQREKDLFSDRRWANLPVHAKEYLRGYWDAKMDVLYQNNLEWRHWVPPHHTLIVGVGNKGALLTREEVLHLQSLGYKDIYQAISEANPSGNIKSTYTWKGEPGKPF